MPWGPYDNPHNIVVPKQVFSNGFCYAAKEHPELAEENGRVIYVTYVDSSRYWLQKLLPTWYYGMFARWALRRIRRERRCRFPHLEHFLHRLAPRPLLMIHGGGDTYIKPEMARALFERVRGPKEFWLVEGAKHNQALQVAGDEYRRRVLAFFDRSLGGGPGAAAPVND